MIRTQLQLWLVIGIAAGMALVAGVCMGLIWADLRERKAARVARVGREKYRGMRRAGRR